MPATTIYLSRLIGLVTLILAAVMLAEREMVLATVQQWANDRPALLLLGLFRVVCGAAVVLVHNVWSQGLWPLVVTLVGWSMLVRGIVDFFVPPDAMIALAATLRIVDFYYVYAALPLVVGAYLSLRGFAARLPPG
ncbi:MAG TPA: hypothetical protein VMB84_14575 [Stellaceae bacterium]|nr:hypothetical protein [Stellaceae bacterium]